MDVTYCPKCATELVWLSSGDRERPTCPACGFVFYFNPVVGAGALVETEGRVVLVRRGVEPKAGLWSLPSGYVEADERAEAAAVRETREETGLEIELEGLLGVYSFGRPLPTVGTPSGSPEGDSLQLEPQTGVLILYSGHKTGGTLRAGDDAQEVRTFAPDELPPDDRIAFGTHLQALQEWRRARAIAYRPATVADKAAVAELSQRFPSVGAQCPEYVSAQDRGLLLAWDRDQLVGIACLSLRPWNRSANIDQVFVHPDYRRWGIATRLVGQAVDHARGQEVRTLLAEAPVTNPVLLVYLKIGFRVGGFIDAYYPPGEEGPVTALFLACDLS